MALRARGARTTPKSEVTSEFAAHSYNAGRAGLVDGAGYPASSWGVGLCFREIWRDVPQYKVMM
jgi:hypothetical protein